MQLWLFVAIPRKGSGLRQPATEAPQEFPAKKRGVLIANVWGLLSPHPILCFKILTPFPRIFWSGSLERFGSGCLHLLKDMFYLPLLVLKGIFA